MSEPSNKRLALLAVRNLTALAVVAFCSVLASNYVSSLLGWCHT